MSADNPFIGRYGYRQGVPGNGIVNQVLGLPAGGDGLGTTHVDRYRVGAADRVAAPTGEDALRPAADIRRGHAALGIRVRVIPARALRVAVV